MTRAPHPAKANVAANTKCRIFAPNMMPKACREGSALATTRFPAVHGRYSGLERGAARVGADKTEKPLSAPGGRLAQRD
jgi:hypothetical protein